MTAARDSIAVRPFTSNLFFDNDPPPQNDLQHDIERYVADSGKVRYRCKACLRSGYWADRAAFLRSSCIGRPETTAQAVSRQRIAQQRKLLSQHETPSDNSPVPLGERALFFADVFRSVIRKNKLSSPPVLETSTAACRALSGFSLPASAGLLRRPLLLTQSRVADEIRQAAVRFHTGSLALGLMPLNGLCRGSLAMMLIGLSLCGALVSPTEAPMLRRQ